MPYTDSGFTKRTAAELLREYESKFTGILSPINNSISDILWQYMKARLYERSEIETLQEIAMEMMSISDAAGIFLDKHGIECGINRKDETKAEGYVEVSKSISDSKFTIPAGTQFKSATNTYISDEETEIPLEINITKTKTGESDDYFPATITHISNIVEIRNSNNDLIDSSYYTLDSVYNNNIQWTVASSAVLIKDEVYTVKISGLTTKRVEVSSVSTGPDANATIGTVTTCVDFPTLTVTNEEEIDGGSTQELDTSYRTRLLEARRRTFTLGNIRSIILGTEGVRTTKVYQDVGVDQTSVNDWDNPLTGETYTITGQTPVYSQSFVPGDHVLTLGRITLYGQVINDPPGLVCGLKRNIAEWGTGTDSPYFDYDVVEKWDLDQSATGMRDIEFTLNFNGLDKTKTYRFDIFCDNPGQVSFDWNTNYWQIATSVEGYGVGERRELFNLTGGSWVGQGDNIDLMFKTHFKGAGYTAVVATEDGYGFSNVKSELTGMLDYVGASENPGYSPVAIQSRIVEATEIDIDVKVVIYISALADFENVRREIDEDIEQYLEDLDVGDNVVYSRIYQTIMDHEQVIKLEDLYIKRVDESTYVQRDLGITDSEIPDLGTRSIQLGN